MGRFPVSLLFVMDFSLPRLSRGGIEQNKRVGASAPNCGTKVQGKCIDDLYGTKKNDRDSRSFLTIILYSSLNQR